MNQAKIQLSPEKKQKLNQLISTNPKIGAKVLRGLVNANVDVSEFTVPSDWTDELAAFGAGIPEGASYGVIDSPDTGSLASTVDLPIVGEVQPARELGRLLGGIGTGGALWKTGYRIGLKPGAKVASAALKKMGATGPTSQRMARKVGGVIGAATPEAIVGSVAEGVREDSWGAVASSLPEWYTLGIGSELGIRALQKYWRKRKAGQPAERERAEAEAIIEGEISRGKQAVPPSQQKLVDEEKAVQDTIEESYQEELAGSEPPERYKIANTPPVPESYLDDPIEFESLARTEPNYARQKAAQKTDLENQGRNIKSREVEQEMYDKAREKNEAIAKDNKILDEQSARKADRERREELKRRNEREIPSAGNVVRATAEEVEADKIKTGFDATSTAGKVKESKTKKAKQLAEDKFKKLNIVRNINKEIERLSSKKKLGPADEMQLFSLRSIRTQMRDTYASYAKDGSDMWHGFKLIVIDDAPTGKGLSIKADASTKSVSELADTALDQPYYDPNWKAEKPYLRGGTSGSQTKKWFYKDQFGNEKALDGNATQETILDKAAKKETVSSRTDFDSFKRGEIDQYGKQIPEEMRKKTSPRSKQEKRDAQSVRLAEEGNAIVVNKALLRKQFEDKHWKKLDILDSQIPDEGTFKKVMLERARVSSLIPKDFFVKELKNPKKKGLRNYNEFVNKVAFRNIEDRSKIQANIESHQTTPSIPGDTDVNKPSFKAKVSSELGLDNYDDLNIKKGDIVRIRSLKNVETLEQLEEQTQFTNKVKPIQPSIATPTKRTDTGKFVKTERLPAGVSGTKPSETKGKRKRLKGSKVTPRTYTIEIVSKTDEGWKGYQVGKGGVIDRTKKAKTYLKKNYEAVSMQAAEKRADTDRFIMPTRGGSGLGDERIQPASFDERVNLSDKLNELADFAGKNGNEVKVRLKEKIKNMQLNRGQAEELNRYIDDLIATEAAQSSDFSFDILDEFASKSPRAVRSKNEQGLDIELQKEIEATTTEELLQEPGLFTSIQSPSSPFGLGKNKFVGNNVVKFALRRIEEMQAWQEKTLGMYSEIRKLIGLPEKSTVKEILDAKMGRVTGRGSTLDLGREKLFKLARLLDTDYVPEANPLSTGRRNAWELAKDDLVKAGVEDPVVLQAYTAYRRLIDEVADHLKLPKNRRISFYLHHMFAGKAGRYTADLIASNVGLFDNAMAQRVLDIAKHAEGLGEKSSDVIVSLIEQSKSPVRPRAYRGLWEREGVPDYTLDLDALTMVMIHGSSQRQMTVDVARRGHDVLSNMPLVDANGKVRSIHVKIAEYLRHVMGRPTSTREKVAQFWADSEVFNRGVDRLIEAIGITPKGINLTKAAMKKEDGTSMYPDEAKIAVEWFDNAYKFTQTIDPQTGKPTGYFKRDPGDFLRNKIALQINDMRQALQNPALSGPVANAVYRGLIVAKLGINFAHGLTNTTQVYVNVWPKLKKGYIAQGLTDYLFSKNKKIGNRSVDELLAESGVTRDITSTEEYMGVLPSTWRSFQEKALIFSKSSEQFNRGVALLSSYRQHLDEGLSHSMAMVRARDFVTETNFAFNRAGTPPLLRGPMMRLAFMFKSYAMHQTGFTANMLSDSGRAISEKGLVQSIIDEDHNELAKHIFAYTTLIGGGLALFPETNIAERSTPPAADMAIEYMQGVGRYGAFGSAVNVAQGPAGDTATHFLDSGVSGLKYISALLDFMEVNASDQYDRSVNSFAKGVGSFTPTLIKKLAEGGMDADLLETLSLKKYEPQKGRKSSGGLEGLGGLSKLQGIPGL
tara:strand:+ start:2378 stop:7714 length:5337 start_codon:yes stop_codon:yes gene_type:complete